VVLTRDGGHCLHLGDYRVVLYVTVVFHGRLDVRVFLSSEWSYLRMKSFLMASLTCLMNPHVLLSIHSPIICTTHMSVLVHVVLRMEAMLHIKTILVVILQHNCLCSHISISVSIECTAWEGVSLSISSVN
jgi:hypothetical protein